MKTNLVIILAAVCLNAFSAEEPKATKAFNAGEFQGELFGQVVTPDLDSERTGYGFGVSYYITESLGAGIRTTFDELSGDTFENISLRGLWRVPVGGKHALYAWAQATRTFHGRTSWGGELGPGYEWRPIEHVGLYGEIGMRKELTGNDRSTDTFGTGEIGLRLTW